MFRDSVSFEFCVVCVFVFARVCSRLAEGAATDSLARAHCADCVGDDLREIADGHCVEGLEGCSGGRVWRAAFQVVCHGTRRQGVMLLKLMKTNKMIIRATDHDSVFQAYHDA